MASSRNSSGLSFKVSPRVLAPLGLEQLQDPALAVLELVKNSWDADAKRVWIDINQKGSQPSIVVRDNGHGMSRADFRDRWLVIGASHKRDKESTRLSRPYIGEKGLGRLASYALGNSVTVVSSSSNDGFSAEVDWKAFFSSESVDSFRITLKKIAAKNGTRIIISDLRAPWTEKQTELLATYTQFLTSLPGQNFKVDLKIDGLSYPLSDPIDTISRIAEATMSVSVDEHGIPYVVACSVGGKDYTWVPFRDFKKKLADPRLAGMQIVLKFYRRDQAARTLGKVLSANEVTAILEQYQGVRVYRNGINVPPYGLRGDDWAALEKQRTSTGGPTMVPGNSQLIGELHVPKSARHAVITAGRAGFSDQETVAVFAEYVRWSVRELGTARRAHDLGLKPGHGAIPSRVDVASKRGGPDTTDREARVALAEIGKEPTVRNDPGLRQKFEYAKDVVEDLLDKNEMTLRLYAQLASTGVAATSFAHELRADFDVVSEAVREIMSLEDAPDDELIDLLSRSWGRIRNFVALFRLLPIKVRRVRSLVDRKEIIKSIEGVSQLVPADRVRVTHEVYKTSMSIVPAELDAILLNLVSNSAKAIAESPQSDSGEIKVIVRSTASDIIISVLDNGCGVSDKVKAVMFEPLEGKFSEGTGMGLAIVRFIADRYRGDVSVNGAPKGFSTNVVVRLRGIAA